MSICKKLVLVALASLAVFAAGCKKKEAAAGSGNQIELRVLNYMELTAPNAATERERVWGAFEKANPDIKIVREDLYNDPFHQKVEAYAAAGRLPDVLYVWPSGRSTTLHTQKLLKDLLPLLEKDGLTSLYTAAALDPAAQGGGYIAMLPRAITSSHAFYVNTEVLTAAGLTPAKTYAELKAQVPVLKAKGIETVIMDNESDWVMQSCLFSAIAGRFGGEGWEKIILSGQAKFTDPDFVNALQFIDTLYKDGVLNRTSLTAAYGDGIGKFSNNQGAYLIDGDWRIGMFITDKSTGQAVISPERQNNFLMTIFPDIEGEKLHQSTSTVLGTGWAMSAAIPSGSAKEEAAWRLIKWLSGTEVQTYMLETGGIATPTVTNIDISSLNLEPLQIAASNFGSQYEAGTVVIDGAFEGEVHVPINVGLQEIGMGDKTPQQVAETIQRAFENWKAKQ
ncbi:MAG: extracellular solute-binding protein [Treponema sp.]|jgi:raffinose/stachyose/melibiose transport system substrate-binding protein|nr:extracellular solute-binding protein [Treponema sp.]